MKDESIKVLDKYCNRFHSNVSKHLKRLLEISQNPEAKLCRSDMSFLEDVIEYELIPEAKAAMEDLAAEFKSRS